MPLEIKPHTHLNPLRPTSSAQPAPPYQYFALFLAMQIDSSIFCFHNLCAQIQSDTSTSTKQEVLKGFLQAYKGDVGLLYKFLLPKYNGRLYHLQDKQLIRLFGAALGVPESTLRTHLQQSGCIATSVQHFFKPRVAPHGNCVLYTGLPEGQGGLVADHPMKKGFSKLTLEDIDGHLEKLSSNGSELSQLSCIQAFLNIACKHSLFAYLRQIKQDLKLGAGVQTVLAGLHPTAGEIFKVCANIQQVVQMVLNPKQGGGGGGGGATATVGGAHYTAPVAGGGGATAAVGGNGAGAPQLGDINNMINMFTPVRPQLAAPSKGVDHVLSKCPNGAFSETKYDGERIQIHMKKAPNGQRQYAFFARSLKIMKADKYEGLQKYFEEAVAGMDSCILDGEILLVDKATSQPLPFGTLGKHKKLQFQAACTCIFIFDILYVNGHSLLTVPLIKRREEMKKHVRFIQNRVMISEMRIVDGSIAQRQAIMERHLKYAVAEGLEGLVIKDMQGVYEPGSRHWIKLKKDYLAGMADSADLVVLGAWYGSGSKGGILSTFLMGVWDKNVKPGGYHQFKTVCKVGNGHDDLTLTAISNDLLNKGKVFKADNGQGKGFNNPIWIDVHNSIIPDVYIKDPMIHSDIWEISAAEFSATKTHSASGISMRFPRVTRIRNDKDIHTATNLQELEALYQTSQIKGSKLGTLAAQHGGAGGLGAAFSASGLSPQHYFSDPNSDDRHEKGVMMRVSSTYQYGPGVVNPDGSLPVVEGQRFGQIDAASVHISSASSGCPSVNPSTHHHKHQHTTNPVASPPPHHYQPNHVGVSGLPPGWGGDAVAPPPPATPPPSAYQTYIQSLPPPPSSKVYVLSTRTSNCNTTLTGIPPPPSNEDPVTTKATAALIYSPGDPSQPLANSDAPHENILILHPVALRPSLSPSCPTDKDHDHVAHGIQWSKKGTMGGLSQFVGDEPQDAYDYYLALAGQKLPPQPEANEANPPKCPPLYFKGKPSIGDVLITECPNVRNQGRIYVASVLCQRLVQSVDQATGVVSVQGVTTDVAAYESALKHIITPFALQFSCGSIHVAKLSMPYYKTSESWGTVDALLRDTVISQTGIRCIIYDRKMKAGSAKQHNIPVKITPFVSTVPIVAGEKKKKVEVAAAPAAAFAEEDDDEANSHLAMLLANPTKAQPLLAASLPTTREEVIVGRQRSGSVSSTTSSLDSPTTRIRRQAHRLSEPDRVMWTLRRNFPLLGHRIVISSPAAVGGAASASSHEATLAAVRPLICAVVLFGGYVQSKWKVTPGRGGDKRGRGGDTAALLGQPTSGSTSTSVFSILEKLLVTRVSPEVATAYNLTSDALLDVAYSQSMLSHFQEAVSNPLSDNGATATTASSSSPAATVRQYGGMLLGATATVHDADDDESTAMLIPLTSSTIAPTALGDTVKLDIGVAPAARSINASPLPISTTAPVVSGAAFASTLQKVLKLGGVAIPVMCNTTDDCGSDDAVPSDIQRATSTFACSLEHLVGLIQKSVLGAMSRALRAKNHRRHRARAARGGSEGGAVPQTDMSGDNNNDSSTETAEEVGGQQEETSSNSDTIEEDAPTVSLAQTAAIKVGATPNKWPSAVLNLHALDDVTSKDGGAPSPVRMSTPIPIPTPQAPAQSSSSSAQAASSSVVPATLFVGSGESEDVLSFIKEVKTEEGGDVKYDYQNYHDLLKATGTAIVETPRGSSGAASAASTVIKTEADAASTEELE